MSEEINFEKWLRNALEAIEHLEAVRAHVLLMNLPQLMTTLSAQERDDIQGELQELEKDLRRVALPDLPIEEVQTILNSNVIEFLKSGIDLGERLSTRHAFLAYGLKEEDRKKLKQALLDNQEKIGESNVGVWLADFDVRYDPEERQAQAILDFFQHNSKVASLDKSDQTILKKILEIYDQWLACELLDLIDLGTLHQKVTSGLPVGKDRAPYGKPSSVQADLKSVVQFPLLQALSKYENLGNQLITQERIKVKSQSEPVRPSLLYWLKYYRDELGIGQHTSVERGEFLFRSENGRKLSAEERERVNLILKSVEENFPLSINTERQEIVFPASNAFSVTMADKPAFQEGAVPTQAERKKEFVQDEPESTSPPASTSLNFGGRNDSFAAKIQRGNPLPRPLPSLQPTKPVSAFLPGSARNNSLDSRSDSGKPKTIGTTAFTEPKPIESETDKEVSDEKPLTTDFSHPYENTGLAQSDSGLRMSRGTSFGVESKKAQEPANPEQVTGGISFSTAHVFPAEREVAESRRDSEKDISVHKPVSQAAYQSGPAFSSVPKPVPAPVPVPKRAAPQPMNSFHIRPVSLGGKDQ